MGRWPEASAGSLIPSRLQNTIRCGPRLFPCPKPCICNQGSLLPLHKKKPEQNKSLPEVSIINEQQMARDDRYRRTCAPLLNSLALGGAPSFSCFRQLNNCGPARGTETVAQTAAPRAALGKSSLEPMQCMQSH